MRRDIKFVINSQNKMQLALCWTGFKKNYRFTGLGIVGINPCP